MNSDFTVLHIFVNFLPLVFCVDSCTNILCCHPAVLQTICCFQSSLLIISLCILLHNSSSLHPAKNLRLIRLYLESTVAEQENYKETNISISKNPNQHFQGSARPDPFFSVSLNITILFTHTQSASVLRSAPKK